ncbi:MAG: DUF4097 family beta strand repeat-containing protein [Candidatus Aminicenantes bacterium]
MKKNMIYGLLFILFFVLITLPSEGDTREETIDETFKIDGGKPVDFKFIENDGNVRFTTWTRDEVHILIRKEVKTLNGRRTERLLKDTKVEMSQHNNSIRVRIRYPRIKGFFFITDSYRIKVISEITIPANTNLDCRSDDGDISVEGVSGELYLKTDDGTIRVVESRGSVQAGIDDGRVYLEDFVGGAKIESDDGDLLLSGNFSMLDLETDDGDIRVKNLAGSAMTDDWRLQTDDGDVDIYFPPDFSADFHISTDDGNIDSLLPIIFKEITSQRNLAGKINDGGFLITVITDDGHITFRETKH